MIQQHLIRSYTSRGYALHKGSPLVAFTECPLGIVSAGVTKAFLAVQKRIDTLLDTERASWAMCFRHDDHGSFPLVGYGGFFEIESHGSREAVAFLHAVALSSQQFLFGAVDGIIKTLSADAVPRLRKDLMALARANANEQELLKRIAGRLEEACTHRPVSAEHLRASLPAAVLHDCAGGPAIAWMTMAASHLKAEPPWEVYDELTSSGAIQTRSLPDGGRESVRASQILGRVVEDYINRGAPTMSKDEERPASSKEVIEHTKPEKTPRLDRPGGPPSVAVQQEPLKHRGPSYPIPSVPHDGPWLASHQAVQVARNASSRLVWLLSGLAIALSLAALAVALGTQQKSVGMPPVAQVKSTDRVSQAALAIAGDARRRIDGLILRALVDQVASGSQADIDAALAELESDWKTDPSIIPMVRTRAARLQDHVPVKNVASILLRVSPVVLKRREAEINDFLASIERNGPETKKVVDAIKARMGV